VLQVEAEWKQRKAERKYVFNMEKQKEKYLRDTKTVERIDYDTVPAPQLHPQVKPSMVKITALHQLGNYSFKVKEKVVHVPGHPVRYECSRPSLRTIANTSYSRI
jgi:hypothetical protein